MDLQYISANVAESLELQTNAEVLMRRILTLQVPTIAALNGHWTAAGAMLGLAFDVRVMPSDGKGWARRGASSGQIMSGAAKFQLGKDPAAWILRSATPDRPRN